MIFATVWGLIFLAGLVATGLITFGIISLATSLFTAVGIGLLIVAAVMMLRTPGHPHALILLALGGALFLLGYVAPDLTVATALQALPGGDA